MTAARSAPYGIAYRSPEELAGGRGWVELARVRTLAEANDMLASPSVLFGPRAGEADPPRLSHGGLFSVRSPAKTVALAVFDADASAVRRVATLRFGAAAHLGRGSWSGPELAAMWDGPPTRWLDAEASVLYDAVQWSLGAGVTAVSPFHARGSTPNERSRRVGWLARRTFAAACDAARLFLGDVAHPPPSSLAALEAVEAWSRGEVDAGEAWVQSAIAGAHRAAPADPWASDLRPLASEVVRAVIGRHFSTLFSDLAGGLTQSRACSRGEAEAAIKDALRRRLPLASIVCGAMLLRDPTPEWNRMDMKHLHTLPNLPGTPDLGSYVRDARDPRHLGPGVVVYVFDGGDVLVNHHALRIFERHPRGSLVRAIRPDWLRRVAADVRPRRDADGWSVVLIGEWPTGEFATMNVLRESEAIDIADRVAQGSVADGAAEAHVLVQGRFLRRHGGEGAGQTRANGREFSFANGRNSATFGKRPERWEEFLTPAKAMATVPDATYVVVASDHWGRVIEFRPFEDRDLAVDYAHDLALRLPVAESGRPNYAVLYTRAPGHASIADQHRTLTFFNRTAAGVEERVFQRDVDGSPAIRRAPRQPLVDLPYGSQRAFAFANGPRRVLEGNGRTIPNGGACGVCGISESAHEGQSLEAFVIRGRCDNARKLRAGERLPCPSCGDGTVGWASPCDACGASAEASGLIPNRSGARPGHPRICTCDDCNAWRMRSVTRPNGSARRRAPDAQLPLRMPDDPLAIPIPPVDEWAWADQNTRIWVHPALGWTFAALPTRRPGYFSVHPAPEGEHDVVLPYVYPGQDGAERRLDDLGVRFDRPDSRTAYQDVVRWYESLRHAPVTEDALRAWRRHRRMQAIRSGIVRDGTWGELRAPGAPPVTAFVEARPMGRTYPMVLVPEGRRAQVDLRLFKPAAWREDAPVVDFNVTPREGETEWEVTALRAREDGEDGDVLFTVPPPGERGIGREDALALAEAMAHGAVEAGAVEATAYEDGLMYKFFEE